MTIHTLVEALIREGVEFSAFLPDSWLSPLLEVIDAADAIRHIPVTREDEGVALVGGMTLGGRKAVLICQNAGLLVAVNALAGDGSHHGLASP